MIALVRVALWGSLVAFAVLGVRHYLYGGWGAALLAFWLLALLWLDQGRARRRADALWKRWRDGDQAAGEEWYKMHEPMS